ncbi:MAG: carboxypeptidase-like regulatory domain-containing protein, partial [Ginsengibacter sp.]
MKQISTLLVLIFFLNSGLSAQTITGILKDASDQSALTNATINLLKKDSSKTNFSTVSNSNGNFSIKDVTNGEYILSVSYIGYENFKKAFSISGQNVNLGSLLVSKSAEVLTEVVISGTPPPVKQRNDTLEYSANQYKLNPDATGEDLLKKMPGITVDKTGSVTAQGENVKKVTVDGRDFFGD